MKKITLVTLIASVSVAALAAAIGIPLATAASNAPEGRMSASLEKEIAEDAFQVIGFHYERYYGAYGNGEVFLQAEANPNSNSFVFEVGNVFFKMDRDFSVQYWQRGGLVINIQSAYLSGFLPEDSLKRVAALHESYSKTLYCSNEIDCKPSSEDWYSNRSGARDYGTIEQNLAETMRETYAELDKDSTYPVIIEDYYGSFSNAHIAFIERYKSIHTEMVVEQIVAGKIFVYPTNQELKCYKDGRFYNLPEAYASGILNEEDISSIHLEYASRNPLFYD